MNITVEQEAQRMLEERGYLVISTSKEFSVGDVISGLDWSRDSSIQAIRDHKVVVIGVTDRVDFQEQHKLSGFECWLNPSWPYYYRVVAE